MMHHVLDPNGDVCLILHRDRHSNSVYNRISQITQANGHSEFSSVHNRLSQITIASGHSEWYSETADVVEITAPSHADEPQVCAEMLVSSRHLILASPVFAAMLLKPNFAEGLELHSARQVNISLYDDDPRALEIVLEILHGHPKKVPRYLSLNRLTKVAIILDKYQILEATDLFVDVWTVSTSVYSWSHEMEKIPYLLSMLCVAWVFKKQDLFTNVTKEAQRLITRRANEYAGFEDLPIPGSVIDKIEECRLAMIGDAIDLLESTMKKYQQAGPQCVGFSRHYADPQNPPGPLVVTSDWNPSVGIACDCTILGGLIKQADANGLYPIPAAPYVGKSYEDVANAMRSMRVPSLCQETMKVKYQMNPMLANDGQRSFDTCHQLSRYFSDRMDEIDAKLMPFQLGDFITFVKPPPPITSPKATQHGFESKILRFPPR